jgi:hypothetical protein
MKFCLETLPLSRYLARIGNYCLSGKKARYDLDSFNFQQLDKVLVIAASATDDLLTA